MTWHRSALALLLAGCGPTIEPTEDGGQDGTVGTSASGTAGGSVTTSVGDSTGSLPPPLTTTSDGGSSDGGTTGDAESICDPQPAGAVAWVSVTGADGPPSGPVDFTACTLVELIREGTLHTIQLDCAEGQPVLEIDFSYPIWLETGEQYELSVWTLPAFRSEDLMLSLTSESGFFNIAAGQSSALPGDTGIPADFTAPIGVERLGEVCEIEPVMETDFVGSCYQVEREALRISAEGDIVDIHDGNQQFVGGHYAAAVRHAEERHELICADVPDRWYQWVVAPLFLR